MNEAEITRYIVETFTGVETDTSTPDTFFFYDTERRLPFATLVTRDNAYDSVSNLNRPGVFRLSIGIEKQTYQAMFGTAAADTTAPTYDYTALDQVLPHPEYGKMYWVAILSPSDETFQTVVAPLLAEAYAKDVAKHARRAPRD